jgi:hypothetical protein
MVLGYMFRPHCGHIQANLYRQSALNVRKIWDPMSHNGMASVKLIIYMPIYLHT